jgi:predicted amidohydrolase
MNGPVRVACVQAEPAILDREATLDKLAALTAEAKANGAQLVVFPRRSSPPTRARLGEVPRRLGRPAREGRVRAARARVGRGARAGSRPTRRESHTSNEVWLVTA